MKAYRIELSYLDDPHDMSHWGDYDWQPSRVVGLFGLFHSPLKAYEAVDRYMAVMERDKPIFRGIKEVTVKPPQFEDDEISDEQQEFDRIDMLNKVAERFAYKNRTFTFGKYNGKRICEVIDKDEKYVKWAVDKGIITLNDYEKCTLKWHGSEPVDWPEYNK